MKQAEYKASRNEAKRCIARIQAEVMKKQVETLDSKEGRQNIFRIAKQKKKERKDITGTNCLKGDNGELLVSEEQVSGRWREYMISKRRGKTGNTRPKGEKSSRTKWCNC